MKTNELTDRALDYAVAKLWYGDDYDLSIPLFDDGLIFAPSTNWAHGGPIIERERIQLGGDAHWFALKVKDDKSGCYKGHGPTPLIAAMRCYVASRLGDDVEAPTELED